MEQRNFQDKSVIHFKISLLEIIEANTNPWTNQHHRILEISLSGRTV